MRVGARQKVRAERPDVDRAWVHRELHEVEDWYVKRLQLWEAVDTAKEMVRNYKEEACSQS